MTQPGVPDPSLPGGKPSSRARSLLRILFYVLVLVILFYIVFPFYWAFRSSITPNAELFATPVSYWPTQPTLENYRLVLSDTRFLQAKLNSTVVATAVTLISLLLGVLAAYALGRFRFRGRTPVLYLVLSMTMFPQIAVLGSLYALITALGLYNILSRPCRGPEEAAKVDGASPLQTLYMVMLPLVAPGLVTTGLLAFIATSERVPLRPLVHPDPRTSAPCPWPSSPSAPRPAGASRYPGGSMAATVVVTIPLIALALIFQRRNIAGLTAGAVKG